MYVNRQLVPDASRQNSGLLFNGRTLFGHLYTCRRGQALPRNIDNRLSIAAAAEKLHSCKNLKPRTEGTGS